MYVIDRNYQVEPEAKASLVVENPLSLDALTAWLETQPTDAVYDWRATRGGHDGCVFARYAAYLGYAANFDGYATMLENWGTFPGDPYSEISCRDPYTLGGALSRARTLQATNGSGS